MRLPIVLAALLLASMLPHQATSTHSAGNDPTCGTGQTITQTSGEGDPQLPSLVYASLKTGFRAAVMWQTEEATTARLRYSIDGGSGTHLITEQVPTKFHLFVIDGLPIGRSFCFTPLTSTGAPAGLTHGMRTQNAMNAHDGTAYTINMMVLSNELPAQNDIDFGLDAHAARIYDATDGHVRIGRTIVIYQDFLHHNSGWATCYIADLFNVLPTCNTFYDVMFSYDAPMGVPPSPGVLAATYSDGIQDDRQAVWMGAHHQGTLANTGFGDVEGVLTHEMGHYFFGGQDLYGPNGGGPNCWDPVTEISIMGNEFSATEFDDEINRCPPGSLASGGTYEPTWTRIIERYPLVPDRNGVINPGPFGDGGIYVRNSIAVVPTFGGVVIPQVEQDDAGSGGDAGSFVQSATPIATNVLYDGMLLTPIDGSDMYVFHAPAGASLEVAAYPRVGCFTLTDADGAAVGGPCVFDGIAVKRIAVAPGGPLYVKFLTGNSPVYRFGVGENAAAPGPL